MCVSLALALTLDLALALALALAHTQNPCYICEYIRECVYTPPSVKHVDRQRHTYACLFLSHTLSPSLSFLTHTQNAYVKFVYSMYIPIPRRKKIKKKMSSKAFRWCTSCWTRGALRAVARKNILHDCQLYIDRPEPIAFMPVGVDTSGRIDDDFLRLLFLHPHRETSALTNEIPEETGQFRFLRASCLANIKESVGLILAKASTMRISIPLYFSSRSFIPLPCFIRSRRPTPLLVPSLVSSPLCSA
jgi:hypothetical protein